VAGHAPAVVAPERGAVLVARPPDAGAPGAPDAAGLEAEAARHLGAYALVVAVGFVAAVVFYDGLLPRPASPPGGAGGLVSAASLFVALLAAGVWWSARRGLRPALVVALGVLLELVAATAGFVPPVPLVAVVAVDTAWDGIPWGCVPLLLFPLVVPGRPRFHAAVALASATLLPAAVLVEGMAGLGWPPLGPSLKHIFPGYLCAGLAALSGSILWRLRLDARAARREAAELGSYQLERRLGRGGMGEVWLARHRLLKRPAAIKLIEPAALRRGGAEAQDLLVRFEREARATSRLRSRHTVELHDFGRTHEGAFYSVMELLDGVDLERLVARFGPQPPARVAEILAQACLSLAEAHDQGLIHRDIKPANLFLCREGRELDVVKVLDFGLVLETTGEEASSRRTAKHLILGTPSCMAPEAALGQVVDGRTDLYALGCVAYWLLTGREVFEARTVVAALTAHIEDAPAPPSARAPRPVPAPLEAIVLRCLAKAPADRFASADDLRAALLAAAPALGGWSADDRRAWWGAIEAPG
jgi:hypothetical protein